MNPPFFSDIFDDTKIFKYGVVAQLVEHGPEEPGVGGSTPPHTTKEAKSFKTLKPEYKGNILWALSEVRIFLLL